MNEYRVVFNVNGKRYEQTVSAYSGRDAKELIKSQFSNANVQIIKAIDVKTGGYY